MYSNMINVSSSGIGHIWAISSDNQVYNCQKNCENGAFQQVDKNIRLNQLDSKNEYVWGLDSMVVHKAPNDGDLPFSEATNFKYVSSSTSNSEFYGVNKLDEIYKCQQIQGSLKQVDNDDNELWGVDSRNNVYMCSKPCNNGNWKKWEEK